MPDFGVTPGHGIEQNTWDAARRIGSMFNMPPSEARAAAEEHLHHLYATGGNTQAEGSVAATRSEGSLGSDHHSVGIDISTSNLISEEARTRLVSFKDDNSEIPLPKLQARMAKMVERKPDEYLNDEAKSRFATLQANSTKSDAELLQYLFSKEALSGPPASEPHPVTVEARPGEGLIFTPAR
jgi:hypothetical protein